MPFLACLEQVSVMAGLWHGGKGGAPRRGAGGVT